jgi:hypothetical protein
MQHRVIAPTLDNHQRGLGLLLGKLIDQPVKSLLRSHRPMVPPARAIRAFSQTSSSFAAIGASRQATQQAKVHLIERRTAFRMGTGVTEAMRPK